MYVASCALYLILRSFEEGRYYPHLTDYETGLNLKENNRLDGRMRESEGISIKLWNWPETEVGGVAT